jgi:hypothetical protein
LESTGKSRLREELVEPELALLATGATATAVFPAIWRWLYWIGRVVAVGWYVCTGRTGWTGCGPVTGT